MHRGTPILVATALSLLVLTSSAIAGNGSQKSSSSIALVQFSSLSAAAVAGPQYGDQVTFAVSTNATDRPYVLVNCYQNGAWVYAAQAGFWASYPSKNFMLASASWGGGAADCTARLGSLNADGTRFRELASTSFSVAG